MKGDTSELTWAFIQIILVLIFVVWAINPIFRSLELAQQNSARLNAQEIAGVINIMKASPEDVTYRASFPSVTCSIEISDQFVKLSLNAGGKIHTAVQDVIQTPVKVSGTQTFQCSSRGVLIERKGSVITVRQA